MISRVLLRLFLKSTSMTFFFPFTNSSFSSFSSGTNNARLAAMLRQLAQYHAKDPNNLFMVRLAQVGGDTNGTLCEIPVNSWWRVLLSVHELLLTLCYLCLRRVWLTWAKAHWHSVPTIATGSWWVRLLWLDCSLSWFPSLTSKTVSSFLYLLPSLCDVCFSPDRSKALWGLSGRDWALYKERLIESLYHHDQIVMLSALHAYSHCHSLCVLQSSLESRTTFSMGWLLRCSHACWSPLTKSYDRCPCPSEWDRWWLDNPFLWKNCKCNSEN